jgi:hypothetical protein
MLAKSGNRMSNSFESLDKADPQPNEGGKLKPHKGPLLKILGILSLFVAPLVVAPITWMMARADLKEMDAGRMDPAGRKETQIARLCAMISTLTWPVLLCCCCVGGIGQQLMFGGRLLPALASRRITEKEFNRVKNDMTKQQVRELIGPPARTDVRNGRVHWYWYEKNGRAEFEVDFTPEDRVGGIGTWTPD